MYIHIYQSYKRWQEPRTQEPILQELLAQRDGGGDGDPVEEDEDAGGVDELGLAAGRGGGALLDEPRLRRADGQQEDGKAGHDVHRHRGRPRARVPARQPEHDEAEQPLQAEEGDGADAEPRVEADEVGDHGDVVVLERRVHAEAAQDEPHEVDQHVRHLPRPVIHHVDRWVGQYGCNFFPTSHKHIH